MIPSHPLATKEPSYREALLHDGHDVDVISVSVHSTGLPWREKILTRCMCKTCNRLYLMVDFVDNDEIKSRKLKNN